MRAREFRGGDTLVVRGVQLAVADVVHYRPREQIGVLQHYAEGAAEVRFLYLVDVDAVVTYLAVLYVVEAVDEVGYGGLARARGAHECYLLTGFRIQRHVVQDELFGHIAEVHVHKPDVAFEFGVSDGAVRLMRMSPRPFARAFPALGDVAVFVDVGVDEFDISVVRLRLVVEELEDTSRTRDSHDDGVNLHRHLPYVERELSAHIEEGDYRTHCDDFRRNPRQGKVVHAAEHQRAAHYGDRHEHDVPDIHNGGHKDVAVAVRLVRIVIEFVVDLGEIALGRFLVAEHLYDLLSVYHFLDEAFRLADGILLTDEELRASAADGLGDEQHYHDAEQHDEREIDAGNEHRDKQRDDADQREQTLRHALGYELAQRVDVVGVIAHYVAVRVRVEISDRQGLHFVEHILADVFEEALRDDGHQTGVDERTQYARGVNTRHNARDGVQRVGDVVEPVFQTGSDDVIHQNFEEYGRTYARDRRHRDADYDGEQLPFVIMTDVAEEPSEDFESASFLDFHSACSHQFSPPSAVSAFAASSSALIFLRSSAVAPILFWE